MFNWGKKNDGFEWHKYVRTTIKLRREDRRRRIEDAKGAAAAGIKQAGVHSAAAGRSLGVLMWNWLANAVTGVGQVGWLALRGLGQVLTYVGQLCWRALKRALQTLYAEGRKLRAVPTLFTVGTVMAASAYLWKLNFGASDATLMAEGGGLALIVTGALVSLWPRLKKKMPRWAMLPRLKMPEVRWRMPRFADQRVTRWAGGAAGFGVAVLAGWWAWPHVGALPPLPELPSVPSMALFGSATELKGRAAAVSGDTLRLNGKLVKLRGIEAPELRQRCARPGGRQWSCGRSARSALAKLVRRATVVCKTSGTDGSGRVVAHCAKGKRDVAGELVKKGYVFAAAGFFAPYATDEKAARAKRRGLWRGKAQRPSDYRTKRWKAAKAKAPGGCPIKGRVKNGKRIFIPPWSPDYSRARVRKSRGERWFCSEAEAFAAGWRPVENS